MNSPEQYRGGDVDSRSDQWSFCAALFEALYGYLPFAGENVREHAESVHGPPRPPPLGTKVPEEVHRALVRGLATDPEKRFPSMAELLAALSQEQRDDEGAGGLSRQRFSLGFFVACILSIVLVQVRMTRNGITHRDAILVSCLVLTTILVGGLWRRSTLLAHRFHRHAWIVILVASTQNLVQRTLGAILDIPMSQLVPFEMVVMAGGTAITAALLMPWMAFVPIIPLVAAFVAAKGYATGRLLSLVYLLVVILFAIGWSRAAKKVKRSTEAGSGSGRSRRSTSSPSNRSSSDRSWVGSRPGVTPRSSPSVTPRSSPSVTPRSS